MAAEEEGLNFVVFDAAVLMAVPIQSVSHGDEQVRELVDKNGAFLTSGLWNSICVSCIGNAEAVIQAQQQQMQMQIFRFHNSKQIGAKLLLNAQEAALQKHEQSNKASMTDKDWGDVIHWMLPEAKVEAKTTDLKKKANIIAKLATLDYVWKMYIPPIAIV